MKKRNFILGSVIMLAAFLVVGGTLAWFTATADPVVNRFTAGTLEIELVDEFEGAPNVNPGDCYEKIVYVINKGTKRALVRVKLDIGFDDEELSTDVVDFELAQGWIDGGDGYYYYEHVLDPREEGQIEGEPTVPLFDENKICFDGEGMGNEYQGAELTITVKAEAIQATNGAPTAEGWAIDPLKENDPQPQTP